MKNSQDPLNQSLSVKSITPIPTLSQEIKIYNNFEKRGITLCLTNMLACTFTQHLDHVEQVSFS